MSGDAAGTDAASTLVRMLHAIDRLDWAVVRGCLADEVVADYHELSGDPAATLSGDALVEQWRGLLPGFDATQHLVGPVLAVGGDADRQRVEAHVRGYHHLADQPGGDVWGVHGHYVVELRAGDDGWRIGALTLQVFYQDGNDGLPAAAQRRAVEEPRAPR